MSICPECTGHSGQHSLGCSRAPTVPQAPANKEIVDGNDSRTAETRDLSGVRGNESGELESVLEVSSPALSDARLLQMWRSVQGPYAQLNGPLIRFAGLVRAALAARDAAKPPMVLCDVAEIRAGEKNDGDLESTDLFVRGPGWHLLCNVLAGSAFTYALRVGEETKRGTVGVAAPPTPQPPRWEP